MKTPLQMFHAGIAIGMSLVAAVMMFFQDLMGIEKWTEFISSNWINFHWAVGLGAIVWTILSYFYYRRTL